MASNFVLGNVKAYCELAPDGFAIISQFIREQTLRKMAGDQRRPAPQNQGHRGTLGNLALKVNGKLGGVNNRIIDDSAGRYRFSTNRIPLRITRGMQKRFFPLVDLPP